ncbi:SDR family NAD(P)-dependent oxidoreductase [Lysobacter sp. A6]|uniref:SDR family NAD(P)-dependent oxidoreductase n=1 Tax=Noviluteimonas lactosilytica TaxID=2888523 RepID=A0ABS8JII1_9GAMM|nr:SDR family NAD(P)-dependent oxidoreductase [Lysobacter lactosilyticus]MCC8363367.1 SDR family NAD(P)-dependent oxidoreductase [Lysobacter lactosilyticus]
MTLHSSLADKTIVITGASSGIGRGVALALAELGANVVVAARRAEALRDLAEECGPNAMAVTTDVADPNDVENLREAALSRFPGIDTWINNAGVAAIGPFDEIPLRDHARVIETNLVGTINGAHVALDHFRTRGTGTLINVASMLGTTPAPYYATYCASKYGIVGLSASLRQELRARGDHAIRICTVMPMAADTTFYDHAANYSGHELLPYPVLQAELVVAAIVHAVANPRDEVTVGLPATMATLSQRVAPWLTESITSMATHELQMNRAPLAPVTEGNLHAPVMIGTGLVGSLRGRMQ